MPFGSLADRIHAIPHTTKVQRLSMEVQRYQWRYETTITMSMARGGTRTASLASDYREPLRVRYYIINSEHLPRLPVAR